MATTMSTKDEIAEIRRLIKQRIPTVSIRNGRGTAWGWVEISGSMRGGCFTFTEQKGLEALGFHPGGNFAVISPDSRNFWLHKLTGRLDANSNDRCIGPGCGRPAIKRFLCPCDLCHPVCQQHSNLAELRVIRLDCASAFDWPQTYD